MVQLKKGDFVEIDFTGKIKDDNTVFDTTNETIAKESGMNTKGASFGPIIICIGESHVLKGLDAKIEGKEVGNSYSVELAPEEAFGKKSAKLLKLVPVSVFRKQNIEPQVGLSVAVDNSMGLVRSVGGGRVIVDFNHPLSGKSLVYDIKINKLVTDAKEKADSILKLTMGENMFLGSELVENEYSIKSTMDFDANSKKFIEEKIFAHCPTIKSFKYIKEEKKPKHSHSQKAEEKV